MRTAYQPDEYWKQRVGDASQLAAVGQSGLGAYNSIAYGFRRRAILKAVSQLNRPLSAVRLFEAGFGTGYYLQLWQSLGIHQVMAMDISPAAVRRAQALFPEFEVLCGDIVQPSGHDGDFDVVTAIDVLYHITDDGSWSQALRNLSRMVRSGGHLVLTDKFPPHEPYQSFAHVRRRPYDWYARELAESGLRVTATYPVFIFMDDPLPCGRPRWLAKLSLLQWRALTGPIRKLGRWPRARDAAAVVAAAFQYPIERIATRLLSRGPNLEMVVAERI